MLRLALAGALLGSSPVAAAQCDLALTNANVWNGMAYEKRTVAIRAGRFTSDAAMAVSLDASFLYLTPPFADAHNHRIDTPFPGDTTHARAIAQGIFYALNPNNVRAEGPTLTGQAGLVDFQATGGGLTRPGGHPQPLYERLAQRGVLGPMKAADLPGKAFHLASNAQEARTAVARVKANGASLIKLYLLDHDKAGGGDGLSGEAFDAAVAEARRLGLVPVVHIESAADFHRAVAAKAHALVHMPYVIDKDRDASELLITAADARAAAAAGVSVIPTVTVAHMIYDGAALRAMQDVQRHNLGLLRSAGVKIGLGADQWALTIHDEMAFMRALAVFDAAEIVTMATTHGAEIAFPGRKIGKIAPGYEASFVGWFRPLTGGWSDAREPAIGMRQGEVMIDTIDYFAKACAKANAAPAPAPAR